MPKLRKQLIIGIGAMISVAAASAQFTGLPLSDILIPYPQYSTIGYHFGGNHFGGMIFLSGFTTISGGTNLIIGGSLTSINCAYQVNGLYYNSMRGQYLWPLDTGNISRLITRDSTTYSSLSLTGGFYTNCTGGTTKNNEIYGQITHQLSGASYTVTAGLAVNTGTNSITQPGTYAGNIRIESGTMEGFLFDSVGGVGEVGPFTVISGTTTTIIGSTQGSVNAQCESFKVVSTVGTDVSLSCSGKNVTDYILNLYESSGGKLVMTTHGATSPYPWTISIATGNYLASCTANIGNNMCNPIAISNLSGEIYTSELGSGQIIGNISMTNKISPIRSAKPKTKYTSEDILIGGLVGPTLAKINKGTLLINGTGVGTTGYVKNGDIIKIELLSSTTYNTTESSVIFIGGMLGTFSVITMDNSGNECNLSKTEKLKVAMLFEFMKDGYSSSTSKRINMLYMLKSMTQDIQDFDYNCSLQYLMDLTDDEIENSDSLDETDHTAPNCKEYNITYDEETASYTSSKFKKKQYFASRAALVRFIDSQNPGDCHVNIYTNESFDYEDTDTTHAAPNGKIYTIKEASDGYFSSTTMTTIKKFDSREGLINYIDKYNPEFPIRDHEVDEDWTPITYAAPNNKEYKIYKTNQGYMSYKLLTIKYFESLDSIKSFIDKNNPSQY